MRFEHIRLGIQDHVATITLNMPATRNALNLEVREELWVVFNQIREDDTIKVVILTGAGEAFCAGGDIRTMEGVTPVSGRLRLKRGQRLIQAMVTLEKPIIAAVNGVAAGAGVSLVLASDIAIASAEATFHVSFVRIGLVPDWGQLYFLPLRVGVAKAKELMLTGDAIEAAEAVHMGLINRAVPRDRLEEEVISLANRLASGPTQSHAMIKAALNRWPASLDMFLEMESTMQAVAFGSEDFDEGRKAFLEKRKPRFQGK